MGRAKVLSEKKKGGELERQIAALSRAKECDLLCCMHETLSYCLMVSCGVCAWCVLSVVSAVTGVPSIAQPRLDQGAAKRFVRGALWDKEGRKRRLEEGEAAPHSKRPATS